MGKFTSKLNGFTLTELIVAVGIMAVVLGGISTAFTHLFEEQRRAAFLIALSELRLTLQQPVIRTKDWNSTTSQNSGMACFSGSLPSSCLALNSAPAQNLVLYTTTQPIPVYDSSNPTSGYTMTGAPCTTFGSSSDCVIKPLLTWKAQCNLPTDPTCLSPLVIVNLNYSYTGPSLGPINLASYGFKIAMATFPLTPAEACAGAAPICTVSQAAICEAGAWTCEEFGL